MNESIKERIREAAPHQAALVGLPFDENSSFLRGAAEAPPLIREALFSSARTLWTESMRDLSEPGLLFDAGDLEPAPWEEADGEIEEVTALLLERGMKPIALGGDHSVTYPVLRAFKWFGPVDVLHFDAHPDLYDELDGNRFSHACPFARIMEAGLARRLVQVGIRTMNAHQREQVRRFGVEVIEMKDLHGVPLLAFDAPVYLSVDLDGIDPSEAPGVVHREPGGLTVRQVISIIQSFGGRLAAADIVEFNPRQDPAGLTAPVAAKLVKEIAGRIVAG